MFKFLTGIIRARENGLSQNEKKCARLVVCKCMHGLMAGSRFGLRKVAWFGWSGTTTSLAFLYNFFPLTRLYSQAD